MSDVSKTLLGCVASVAVAYILTACQLRICIGAVLLVAL